MKKLSHILFFVFLILLTEVVSGSIYRNNLEINQGTYDLSAPAQITESFGNAFNITVTLLLDSSPVDNAYFQFENGIIDIAESQYYIGSGQYNLVITIITSKDIPPGIHQTVLIGKHNGNEVKQSIQLIITSSDIDKPSLNIISPTNLENFNLTIFKIQLEIEDNVEWRDLNITIGNLNLVYYKRAQVSFNNSIIYYNQTYLYYENWIDLRDLKNIEDQSMSIIARDLSFNEAIIGTTLIGDYTKPSARWISHQENQIIDSRNITLEWEAKDNSNIHSQVLKLNGIEFLTANKKLIASQRSVNIFIPISASSILEFTLIVTDSFGNWVEIRIKIIYNAQTDKDGGFFQNSSINSDNLKIVLLVLISTIIAIPLIVILRRKIKMEGRVLKTKQVNIPKELIQLGNVHNDNLIIRGLIEKLGSLDLSSAIILSEIQFELDSIIINDELDFTLKNEITSILSEWVNILRRNMK